MKNLFPYLRHHTFLFDGKEGASGATTDQNSKGAATGTEDEIVFDQWLEKQDPKLKEAYTKHNTGLLNSVKATRKERDDISRELTAALKKAEAGSELEKQLLTLQGQLSESKQTELFLEDSLKPEIGCSNPRAALLVAKAGALFGSDGKPDWDKIKATAPEFFKAVEKTPEKKQPQKFDASKGDKSGINATMNDAIRSAAGKNIVAE